MATDAKALARRFYEEVLNQGKLDVLDEILSDDFVEHQEIPGMPSGKDGVRAYVTTFRDAFPDLRFELQAVVAEGDEVWVHAVMTGTQKGDLPGIPATGEQVSITMIDRVRVRDGQAVEHWGASDDLGMMTQLGVIPEIG